MNKPSNNDKQQKYISNPFSLIIKGFSNLFESNQTMAIIILIFGSLGALLNFVPGPSGGSTSSGTGTETMSGQAVMLMLVIVGIVLLVILPIIIFVGTIFRGIVAYTTYQTSKGNTVNFADALSAALKRFWTLLWIDVVVFFKILGGTLLFIIQGIRASLRYRMVHLHVFDENADTSTAIKNSKALTKDHLLEVFGMITAASIIPFVGMLMEIGGQSIMYPQLKNLKASGAPKPPVHWLNYLGFILIGLVIIIVSPIVAAILLIVK